MKKIYNSIILFSIFFVTVSSSLNAQVTIGSHGDPSGGALLDLKEYNAKEDLSTTTKGLKLPRVNLSSKTDLFPMFLGNSDYETNANGKKDSEDLRHIGLIVYNIGDDDLCKDMYKGIFYWDGNQWIPYGNSFPSKTDILVDTRDPAKTEKYQIGEFGEAGWWMLENLRAERWPDGTTTGIYKEPGKKDYPKMHPLYYAALFWYPKLDRDFMNTHPEYGYVYNGWAALRTTWEEMLAGKPTTGIQGICPNGWHVPTEDEWIKLAFTIADNLCPYTINGSETDRDYNMMSQGELPLASSRSRKQGGFDCPLLGSIISSTDINPAPDYDYFGKDDPVNYPEYFQNHWNPELGLYWASNTTDSEIVSNTLNLWGYTPYINGNINFNKFARLVYSAQVPVRCKKDETTVTTKSISNETTVTTKSISNETIDTTKSISKGEIEYIYIPIED